MTAFGKPFQLSDLPERLQQQIREGATPRLTADPGPDRAPIPPGAPTPPRARQGPKKAKGPNKTELEAFALFPYDFDFEGRVFDICGGARYTPDGVDLKRAVALEAKGEFIHSRDSRRRFDEARTLYPGWTWIWARKRDKGRKGRRWEIEIYQSVWKEAKKECGDDAI
jgi:hypothetical protein